MQLQFENRVGLNSGERLFRIELGRAAGGVDVDLLAAEVRDQVFARVGTIGAGANDGDHVVEMIERGEVAFENVLAVFRLLQQVSSAAPHHIHAMIDEMLDRLNQAHFLRLSVHHRQEDHAEKPSCIEVCLKSWLSTICGSPPRFSSTTMRMPSRSLSSRMSEMSSMILSFTSCGDALDQAGFVYLIGNFGDDDGLAVFVESFDGGFGAHHEAAAAVLVGFEDSSSCRE